MAKKYNGEKLPSKADVTKYIMLSAFLEAAYVEMKDFSKKNPDAALNERKVKSLNRVLKDIKDVLASEPTAAYMYNGTLCLDRVKPLLSQSLLGAEPSR